MHEADVIAAVAALAGAPGGALETGIGDDCAVVRLDAAGPRRHLLTTDALIAGTHFDLRYMSLGDVSYKALTASLSDVNAMGGQSLLALATLGVPPGSVPVDLAAVLEGTREALALAAAAGQSVQLAGGDTVAAPQWQLAYTVVGACDGPPLLRSGARVGDELWHSGTLGLAQLGLWELWQAAGSPTSRPAILDSARAAHRRPAPPLALGPWLHDQGLATAAQDLSDSLSQVAAQLASASGVGLRLDFRGYSFAPELRGFAQAHHAARGAVVVPAAADPGGRDLRFGSLAALLLGCAEDFQLLFTAPPSAAAALAAAPVPCTRIGAVVPAEAGMRYTDETEISHEMRISGYTHSL